jgi:cbb3-type cytochrome oxidase subunit 3
MRRIVILTAVLVAVLAAAPIASAQTVDEVADAARDQGFYIEPGVGVDAGDIEASVTRANQAGYRFAAVILDEDPTGGAVVFAGAVLDRLGSGTVLVLSAGQEGADSTEVDQAVLELALDAGFEAGSDEGYVDAFVEVLVGDFVPVNTTQAQTGDGGGGGGSGLWILLIIVAVLVALVWWAIRRSKKSAAASEARRIAEARSEIQGQLDAMANTILEISDQVSVTETRQDNEYFQQASATFAAASEAFPEATTLGALEDLSDGLDEARWQLDAAEAVAEGRPVPPKPTKEERHACFFDPTHIGPFEDAQLKTSAGTKTVRVCKADAERLRRGEEAKTRMIEVGGQRVPAPMAPRSYGGGGLDWLDVFSVAVGGAVATRSYDWGASRTSSRRRSTSSTSATPGTSGRTRSRAGRTRRRGR